MILPQMIGEFNSPKSQVFTKYLPSMFLSKIVLYNYDVSRILTMYRQQHEVLNTRIDSLCSGCVCCSRRWIQLHHNLLAVDSWKVRNTWLDHILCSTDTDLQTAHTAANSPGKTNSAQKYRIQNHFWSTEFMWDHRNRFYSPDGGRLAEIQRKWFHLLHVKIPEFVQEWSIFYSSKLTHKSLLPFV